MSSDGQAWKMLVLIPSTILMRCFVLVLFASFVMKVSFFCECSIIFYYQEYTKDEETLKDVYECVHAILGILKSEEDQKVEKGY